MLNAGGTVLTLSLTRPVWVRAYVDERNLSGRSRDVKFCFIPMAARINRTTAKSALCRQQQNLRRKR